MTQIDLLSSQFENNSGTIETGCFPKNTAPSTDSEAEWIIHFWVTIDIKPPLRAQTRNRSSSTNTPPLLYLNTVHLLSGRWVHRGCGTELGSVRAQLGPGPENRLRMKPRFTNTEWRHELRELKTCASILFKTNIKTRTHVESHCAGTTSKAFPGVR